MKKQLSSLTCRILFIASFIITGVAIWEKLANIMGFTLMRGYYTSWHLLEIAAVVLLFVIALQLREIKSSLASNNEPS